MARKLIKYGKFLLSVALIFSLMTPLMAANDGNGDAFITKEEFDSSLADLNKRLTMFETGINSKIDSQVSSYLDRNGIWNGSKQTLVNNVFEKKFVDVLGITLVTKTSYTHNNGGTAYMAYKSTSYTNVIDAAGGFSSHKETIGNVIDKVEKAGLMNVIGEYGDGGEHPLYIIRTSNNYGLDGCFVVRLIYKIQKNLTGDENTMWNGQWTWENNSNEAYYSNCNVVNVYWPIMNFNTYFFVEKGDKIFIEYEGQILNKNSSARTTDTEKVRMSIKEVQIY